MTDAQLIVNGYEPVVCAGKAPVIEDWQLGPVTIERIGAERAAHPGATNTGLRAGILVGVDIDIINPDHVAMIEALAYEILGHTSLKRVGAKGMMLCYRNVTPIKKITITGKGGKVEILGAGQQFIAYGIHPDTGKPYRWINSDDVSALDPLNVPLADLPAVTPAQLRAFAHRVKQLMEMLGYGDVEITGDMADEGKRGNTSSPKKGKPVQAAHLQEILGYIDPDIERLEWLKIIGGIHNTNIAGDDGGSQSRGIAHEWSEGKLDRLKRYEDDLPSLYTCPADVERAYDTMPPRPDGVGYGTIFDAARKAGYSGPPAQRSVKDSFAPYLASLANAENNSAKTTNLFSTRAEDEQLPPPSWLVENLLPDNTDIMLAGPSGTCKSFMAIDIGCAIAAAVKKPDILALGQYSVHQPGIVFYCAAEGAHSVRKKRVTAWEIARELTPYSLDNFLIAAVPPLLTGENIKEIIDSAKAHMRRLHRRTALWIIDTMSRSLNGTDEDRASTASAYLNMLTMLRTETGGSTLTIHHHGKDETKGPRGSSAFYAGFDTVITIDRKGENESEGGNSVLAAHIPKQKDGEDGQKFFLRTQKIILPDNQQSLVLEPTSEDDARRAAGKQVGLRRTDVGAALKARGACPGGMNEWNSETKKGGIDTQMLATQIAETRAAAASRNPTDKEISTIVTNLNRGAKDGGPFEAYVVSEKRGRQWALPPSAGEGGTGQ